MFLTTQENRTMQATLRAAMDTGALLGIYTQEHDTPEYHVGFCVGIRRGRGVFSLIARDASPNGEMEADLNHLPVITWRGRYLSAMTKILTLQQGGEIRIHEPQTLPKGTGAGFHSELSAAKKDGRIITVHIGNGAPSEFFGRVMDVGRSTFTMKCHCPSCFESEGMACISIGAISEIWRDGYRHGVAESYLAHYEKDEFPSTIPNKMEALLNELFITGRFLRISTKRSGPSEVIVVDVSKDTVTCVEYPGIMETPLLLQSRRTDIIAVHVNAPYCNIINELKLKKNDRLCGRLNSSDKMHSAIARYNQRKKLEIMSIHVGKDGCEPVCFTGIVLDEDTRRIRMQEVNSSGIPDSITFINKSQISHSTKNTLTLAGIDLMHRLWKQKSSKKTGLLGISY